MSSLFAQRRLVALLCAFALLSSWAHIHSPPHEAHASDHHQGLAHETAALDDQSAQLARDDAHHEHSSKPFVEVEICIACRSSSDTECGPARISTHSAIAPPSTCMSPRLALHAPDASTQGSQSPRAPPFFRTSPNLHT